MKIHAVMEYNAEGYLIYAANFIGAFVRGRTKEEALAKFPAEIRSYLRWLGREGEFCEPVEVEIVQEKLSNLKVCDADSDVIFHSETQPLQLAEYEKLKALALKSATDFQALFDSIPNKTGTTLLPRKTFYGDVPVAAEEMYLHTMNVNSYYFGEIGVKAKNGPDILSCRQQGFAKLEDTPDFLANRVHDGSYGEQWSLRKVMRRFVWHDRIHARAMFKMAAALCGRKAVQNPFRFDERQHPRLPE